MLGNMMEMPLLVSSIQMRLRIACQAPGALRTVTWLMFDQRTLKSGGALRLPPRQIVRFRLRERDHVLRVRRTFKGEWCAAGCD